jgi:hypothetical protein
MDATTSQALTLLASKQRTINGTGKWDNNLGIGNASDHSALLLWIPEAAIQETTHDRPCAGPMTSPDSRQAASTGFSPEAEIR